MGGGGPGTLATIGVNFPFSIFVNHLADMEDRLHVLKAYIEANNAATETPVVVEAAPEISVAPAASPTPDPKPPKLPYNALPPTELIVPEGRQEKSARRRLGVFWRKKKAKVVVAQGECAEQYPKESSTKLDENPADISEYDSYFEKMEGLLPSLTANVECLRRKSFARLDPFNNANSTQVVSSSD